MNEVVSLLQAEIEEVSGAMRLDWFDADINVSQQHHYDMSLFRGYDHFATKNWWA